MTDDSEMHPGRLNYHLALESMWKEEIESAWKKKSCFQKDTFLPCLLLKAEYTTLQDEYL